MIHNLLAKSQPKNELSTIWCKVNSTSLPSRCLARCSQRCEEVLLPLGNQGVSVSCLWVPSSPCAPLPWEGYRRVWKEGPWGQSWYVQIYFHITFTWIQLGYFDEYIHDMLLLVSQTFYYWCHLQFELADFQRHFYLPQHHQICSMHHCQFQALQTTKCWIW